MTPKEQASYAAEGRARGRRETSSQGMTGQTQFHEFRDAGYTGRGPGPDEQQLTGGGTAAADRQSGTAASSEREASKPPSAAPAHALLSVSLPQ